MLEEEHSLEIFLLKLAVVVIEGIYLKATIRGEWKNLTITFMSVMLIESTGLHFFFGE